MRTAPHYPVNELAAKYDASVQSPTDDPAEAYADWARGAAAAGAQPVDAADGRRRRRRATAAAAGRGGGS